MTKQSSYLHKADIDQTWLYAKFCPPAGQLRLNYRILDTLIAPAPAAIDQQSISNENYQINTKLQTTHRKHSYFIYASFKMSWLLLYNISYYRCKLLLLYICLIKVLSRL